jgi:hypothetical protein
LADINFGYWAGVLIYSSSGRLECRVDIKPLPDCCLVEVSDNIEKLGIWIVDLELLLAAHYYTSFVHGIHIFVI